jgi:ABC-type Fe3+ transport system substrate-binding protein
MDSHGARDRRAVGRLHSESRAASQRAKLFEEFLVSKEGQQVYQSGGISAADPAVPGDRTRR